MWPVSELDVLHTVHDASSAIATRTESALGAPTTMTRRPNVRLLRSLVASRTAHKYTKAERPHFGMWVRVGVGVAVLNLAASSAASGPWSLTYYLRRSPVADLDGIPGRRPCLAVAASGLPGWNRSRRAGIESA